MKTYQLTIENKNTEFAIKQINDYNPFAEYFVINEENKDVYIIRDILEKGLYLINLKYNSPAVSRFETNIPLTKEEFKKLPDKYTVIQLPYYSGGIDGAAKAKKFINNERTKLYNWLIANEYL